MMARIVALLAMASAMLVLLPLPAAAVGQPQLFVANLSGAQQVPPTASAATGRALVLLSADQTTITVNLSWAGLASDPTAAHIHNAPAGANGPIALDANSNPIDFSGLPAATTGAIPQQSFTVNAGFVTQLQAGDMYINIHDATFPNGEIRGQLLLAPINCTISGKSAQNQELFGCNLAGRVLQGVDFSGADLTDANLAGAVLAGANLTGADLNGANLSGATLFRATVTGATSCGAIFKGTLQTGETGGPLTSNTGC